MSNWIEYKLDKLCEVGRGSSPRPIIDQRYFEGGKIPWIKIADATASGKYIYETKEHVNEYGASFSRYLDPDSLIIAASGVSLGQIKFLGVKGCIHDGWLYTSKFNSEIILKEFLYYFLIFYADQFHNFSSGAAIQNINTEILRNTKVPCPPIETQKKIASILSSYDDLIENNNKRITLLEEMAAEIYKEWFVRFRFPNYQNTRILDKEGKEVAHGAKDAIPEGWEVVKLGERFDISLGGTPSREIEKYWDGSIAWINSGKVNDLRVIQSSELITDLGLQKSATKLLPKKTTLLAITGATLGQVSFLEIESCTNQSIVGIKDPKNEIDEFVFLAMKRKIKDLMNYATGGAQQHINKNVVNDAEILIGTELLMIEFSKIVKPQFDLIALLLFKNQILQETRDLLLPRLISGKLSVEDLEVDEMNMAAEPQEKYSK